MTITKIKEIEKRFGATAVEPERYQINANVTPGQFAPVITNENPQTIDFLKFGFTPFWAKKQMYVINARSEGDHNKEDDPSYQGAKGIINKPFFRTSIRKKRCLVIADAFIEGPKKEKLSKPYCVYLREGERPFAFAGVWDTWTNKETGELIDTFAIITTTANSVLQKIGHHRSPVILDQNQEKLWLDQSIPLNDVTSMLTPLPGEAMNAYPISPAIKNPRVHDLDLLKPVGERVEKEYEYELYSEIQLEGMGAAPARKRKDLED